MKAAFLIRLYPRAWRERYGEEFATLVSDQPVGPRVVLDILAGALDAHLAPQLQAAGSAGGASARGGDVMKVLAMGCRGSALSRSEQIREALIMIGITIVLSLAFIGGKRVWGERLWLEALGIAVFPLAAMISTLRMYFSCHSLAARLLLGAALLGGIYLICLVAAWV